MDNEQFARDILRMGAEAIIQTEDPDHDEIEDSEIEAVLASPAVCDLIFEWTKDSIVYSEGGWADGLGDYLRSNTNAREAVRTALSQ